jgi:hypothetical protein
LTAAITMTLAKNNPKVAVRSFDSIDNAPEEKARGHHDQRRPRGVRDQGASLRARGLPRATPTTSRT